MLRVLSLTRLDRLPPEFLNEDRNILIKPLGSSNKIPVHPPFSLIIIVKPTLLSSLPTLLIQRRQPGVSSTRVGDHRGSARTVQFLIISLSSPHLRSARARAGGGEGRTQRTWPNSGQSFLSPSKGSTVESVFFLRHLART